MKKLLFVLLFATIAAKGFGQFFASISYPSSVDLFGLCEVSFNLSKNYSNPYDPDTINVYAVFTGPDNSSYTVHAFYYEDYTFNQHADGYEVAVHHSEHDGWRIRFTPTVVGTWSFYVWAFDKNGEVNLPFLNGNHTFSCIPVSNANGFISKANSRFLKREVVRKGLSQYQSYFPIGPNIAWYDCNYQNGQPIYSQPQGIWYYERYIDSLYGNANYMRIWLNRYQYLSLYGPEHAQFDGQIVYFDSTINQKDSAELDYIIEYAAQHGISIMPCVFSFGDFRSCNDQEPNAPSIWSYNPFNTILGLEKPVDFFSNTNAKNITKNLLRYIVSRWGYATNIMCWELWNEVSNMFKDYDDGTGQLQAAVLSWHNEMASYIRTCDPYSHCVSTSMGTTARTCDSSPANYNDTLYHSLFDTLDLVLQHNYQNINKAKSAEQFSKVLYDNTTKAHTDYPTKPFFMGEFAFGQFSLYAEKDSYGIDLHNSLWSSLFSTAIGPASMWWWTYLKDCHLYHNRYSPLLTFCQNLPVLSGTFTPHQTGDLVGLFGHRLEFPNNIETYYMINAIEDTIYGWCQDTAFAYQSLRWLTDSVQLDTAKPYYLHFMDSIVFDTLGYVYKLTIDKRPDPSYNSNIIEIPISNQSVGTYYKLKWYNTETGLPYFNYITLVRVNLDAYGDKVLRIGFPSAIRDLKNNTITNTFGDAVFTLTKYDDNPSFKNKEEQPTIK